MATYSIDFGTLYENQLKFCKAEFKFIGYGGARGGGKTHVLCAKCIDLCLKFPGINILITRRKATHLKGEIVPKLLQFIGKAIGKVCKYNDKDGKMTFYNGSTISLKHFNYEKDHVDFQGMSYDVIFMDEATQFTEFQFNVLKACLRLSGRIDVKLNFRPRFYLTCNPKQICFTNYLN